MPNPAHPYGHRGGRPGRHRRLQQALRETMNAPNTAPAGADIDVGSRLRALRAEQGLSIRTLAVMSGLNVNTLSLIENGKTSPSVSTLQQLAAALQLPIAAFFVVDTPKHNISFLKAGQRPRAAFAHGTLEDLGGGLTLRGGEPYEITLEPNADSGETPLVHTGYEFVYCLEGSLNYTIEERAYPLQPGDSLLFEAHLPHRWQNRGKNPSRSLLVLCPADDEDYPTEQHFVPE
jgi:transcriptional regulator with XRE-family HTH domain